MSFESKLLARLVLAIATTGVLGCGPDVTDNDRKPDAGTPGGPDHPAVMVASGLTYPAVLALDEASFYVSVSAGPTTDYGKGAVLKAPLGGGSTTTLAPNQRTITGLAVQGATVYWTSWGSFEDDSNDPTIDVLRSAPTAGGPVATLLSGLNGPNSLAVDADHLYWTEASGTLADAVLAGGKAVALATKRLFPESVVVDAQSVYWVDGGDSEIGETKLMKVSKGGGAPTKLASFDKVASGSSIAVDAKSVYWTISIYASSHGSTVCTVGEILRVPLDGGTPVVLASGQNGPGAIALDATDIYWVNLGTGHDGSVMKLPVAGGQALTLATSQAQPTGLALDDDNVYWTIAVPDGAIMKVPKD